MSLSSFLEDDFYLEQTLKHLIDYGVHECRLVCRRWKALCDKLPLKLKRTDNTDLSKIPSLFPNATSVATTIRIRSRESTEEGNLFLQNHFRNISQMKGIQNVSLYFAETWNFLDLTPDVLSQLENVPNLKIDRIGFGKEPKVEESRMEDRYNFDCVRNAPFLKKIVSLCIHAHYLVSNTLCFSSLTSLYSLTVMEGSKGLISEVKLAQVRFLIFHHSQASSF